jgi:hypothetical protein
MSDLADFRCLITGSRGFTDEATIFGALSGLPEAAWRGRFKRLVIVHGACSAGADAIADRWVRSWIPGFPVTAERHPALWRKYGARAGIVRNEIMVSRGAHLCLAFLAPCSKPDCGEPRPHDSHGATHCAELATDRGFPTRVWHLGQPGVTSMDSRHLADEDVLP